MIQQEHAQSNRMREGGPPADHWQPFARQFRADPRRANNPLVNRLLQEIEPGHVAIDVGAGGGRLALPLAFKCQRVVAVEPSESMASVLEQQAAEYGIDNLTLVRSSWEEAEVEPADLVFCVHVLYTIQPIESFVRKLESRARQRALVVLHDAPPQSQIYPLWRQVHGEARLPLPSLPEFEEVLSELGIDARIERLPPQPERGFDSVEQAMQQVGQRLYLAPGAPQERRLREILADGLEETDGVYRIRGSSPLTPALVQWQGNPAPPA